MKELSIFVYLESYAWLFKSIFYTGLVVGCYLAFSPVEDSFQTQVNDKLLHFTGFWLMSLFAQLAHPKTNFWVLGSGLILFGLAIELIQAYLPYRSFSWWDWAADALGVATYFLVFGRLLKDRA